MTEPHKRTLSLAPRAIILGAGKGQPAAEHPQCLAMDPFGNRILDWILSALRAADISEIIFVGGYHIEEIGSTYPDLNYIFSPDWQGTGVLASLHHAREEITGPVLVSYADIVYRSEACRKLLAAPKDGIAVAVDGRWRGRAPKSGAAEVRKNMVVVDGERVRDIGFLPADGRIDAEFTGLTYFNAGAAAELRTFLEHEYPNNTGTEFEQATDVRMGYMTDLIRYFMARGQPVHAVDVGADWAEIEQAQDLAAFVMGTKGETLERLAGLTKKGRFCEQRVYTVGEWRADREGLLASIGETFYGKRLVVRSSAAREDTWASSLAGAFDSVLDVPAEDHAVLGMAIDRVVQSYERDVHEVDPHDQILVQVMVADVAISGVVLSRDMVTGAPYYVINYDASGRTDAITSGAAGEGRHVSIHRSTPAERMPADLAPVVEVVRELEENTGCAALDVEFAVDRHGEVFVLQARPLAAVAQRGLETAADYAEDLESARVFLETRFKRQPGLYGETTLFGDMPDWNPAEMIGAHPSPLALSLYERLITDSAWRRARARAGYHDPEPATLMISVAGHPYIDVRCSFNNLLPAHLPDELAEKLIAHYLGRLAAQPELHDKIEFDICLTCLDFSFDAKADTLRDAGFTENEVHRLRDALLGLTNRIVSGEIEPVGQLMSELERLDRIRAEALAYAWAPADIPSVLRTLLASCEDHGTIPFSILARYGFIGNALLRSLVERQVVSAEQAQAFQAGIRSVATELIEDMQAVHDGTLSLDSFLATYGHLRPGTYDITSYRYDEKPETYFAPAPSRSAPRQAPSLKEAFTWPEQTITAVSEAIREAGFSFSFSTMIDFIVRATELREKAKFEFTRTVSDALRLLTEFGASHGLSREDLSYLRIEQVLPWGTTHHPGHPGESLRLAAEEGRRWVERCRMTQLPHLITSTDNLYVVAHEPSRPNFVTLKKVSAQAKLVERDTRPEDLEGCIALIEGADPGYDWIFGAGIVGMITKYGGAASHMTIRAAEFGMPAAVGCGELLFKRISRAGSVELDCPGKQIRVL